MLSAVVFIIVRFHNTEEICHLLIDLLGVVSRCFLPTFNPSVTPGEEDNKEALMLSEVVFIIARLHNTEEIYRLLIDLLRVVSLCFLPTFNLVGITRFNAFRSRFHNPFHSTREICHLLIDLYGVKSLCFLPTFNPSVTPSEEDNKEALMLSEVVFTVVRSTTCSLI